MIATSRRHLLFDALTLLLLVGALWISWLPGSRVRVEVERFLKDRRSVAGIRKGWEEALKSGSVIGGGEGSLTVLEIADYECPYCRSSFAAVDSAIAQGIRVVYLHYPLKTHTHAMGAAVAATCAESQGRFVEMHRALMTTSDWQKDADWMREASRAGVGDLSAFQACIDSRAARARVEAHMALAVAAGIDGTPMFATKSAVHRGALSALTLDSLARK